MNDIMKKTWRGLLLALTMLAMVNVNAASFSYQGLNYTDSTCTTGFSMDPTSGLITCSSSTTTASATAAPVCSITQGPAFAQNGSVPTIYSSCSLSPNNPTSYSWSLTQLTPTVGTASTVATTQNYSPSTLLSPGTYTVSLAASNAIGAATGTLSTTLTVNPPSTSGDKCAALGLVPKTDVTDMNWGTGNRKSLNLKSNEVYVLNFTAPLTMASYRSIATIYSATTKLITISKDACGFDTPAGGVARCSMQQDPAAMTNEAGPTYSLSATTPYCKLEPGVTYKVNIRNAKPTRPIIESSCTNAAGCGFSLTY